MEYLLKLGIPRSLQFVFLLLGAQTIVEVKLPHHAPQLSLAHNGNFHIAWVRKKGFSRRKRLIPHNSGCVRCLVPPIIAAPGV